MLIVCILMITYYNLSAQDSYVKWEYPIKYGSDEWAERDNPPEFFEGLKLLNIPSDILGMMSTNQLVEVCLDYPLFGLVFTRNNMQQGYEFIRSHFNGFRELEDRPDACKCLLEVYEKMNPSGFAVESSPAQIGEYMAQFTFIELLLAQYPILNNADELVKKKLIEESLNKYKEKSTIESYGIDGILTSAFVMARVVNSSQDLNIYEKIENDYFLRSCSIQDTESLESIIKQIESNIHNE